jgi:hypothetical protein
MVVDSQLLFYLMKAKHQQQLKSKKKKKKTERCKQRIQFYFMTHAYMPELETTH